MSPQLMPLTDAAPMLHVTRKRIYELAKLGTLPGIVRLGPRQIRIDRAKLEAFIADGGVRPECAA